MFTFVVLSVARFSFIFFISFLTTNYIVNLVLELYFSLNTCYQYCCCYSY